MAGALAAAGDHDAGAGAGAEAERDGPVERSVLPTRQVRPSNLLAAGADDAEGAGAAYDDDLAGGGAYAGAWGGAEEARTGSRADTRALPTRHVLVTNASSRAAAGAAAVHDDAEVVGAAEA